MFFYFTDTTYLNPISNTNFILGPRPTISSTHPPIFNQFSRFGRETETQRKTPRCAPHPPTSRNLHFYTGGLEAFPGYVGSLLLMHKIDSLAANTYLILIVNMDKITNDFTFLWFTKFMTCSFSTPGARKALSSFRKKHTAAFAYIYIMHPLSALSFLGLSPKEGIRIRHCTTFQRSSDLFLDVCVPTLASMSPT